MYVVPEEAVARLLTPEAAFEAVEAVFAAMHRGEARNFPVVREALGHAEALYGFKSGFDRAGGALGLKSGGYWPGNAARGLTNHQSSVFLFDPDSGRLRAALGGNHLTALRTAAAAAVSIKHLAPEGARTLGLIGAGHQSAFQLRAALATRPFDRVLAWNRTPGKLAGLERIAREAGCAFEAAALPQLGAEADVIISIVSSPAAILKDAHVRGPVHIAAMGTDTRGKQELEPALVARARCFTDERTQSVSLGECQHAVAAGLLAPEAITEIGAVIAGDAPGRGSEAEVTLFDGTGVGLQDLAVAARVVDLAREAGAGQEVPF